MSVDFGMEIGIFLAYGVGFFTIFFFGKVLAAPVKVIGRLLFNSLAGAGVIALINIVGSAFGVGIPLNLLNSFIIGLLGIPGVLMLCLGFFV